MTVSIDIHPSSSSLPMYGWPERSTAYSLSGHVSIKLSPDFALFESSKPVRILLRSLKLIFEGHSELVTQQLGYSSTRLVRMRHELAPKQSMILSNDNVDEKDTKKESVWNFNFNIPIPGWLPSTCTFGNDQYGPAGTRYALFAEARYIVLGQHANIGFLLSSVQSLLGSRQHIVRAEHVEIHIQRVMLPPILNVDPTEPMGVPAFPKQKLSVKPAFKKSRAGSSKEIDPEIMRDIEVEAYMPEFINIDDSYFKLNLKLRASKLSSEQRSLLKIDEIVIDDLIQSETYTNSPSSSYEYSFPLPKEQPDTRPLLNPHPLKAMFDVGLVSLPPEVDEDLHLKKSFSFSHSSNRYHQVEKKEISFAPSNKQDWLDANLEVNFVAFGGKKFDALGERHGGLVTGVRVSEQSPLFSVSHYATAILKCSYGTDEDKATSDLRFCLPLHFVRVPPLSLANNLLFCGAPAKAPWIRSPMPALPVDEDVAESFRLPPYSQLFLPNGDRRPDHQIPLPAYAPHDPLHPTLEVEDGQIPCSIPYSI